MKFEIGTRVRVKLSELQKESYARGAAESLNGKEGIIAHIHSNGRILVNFDTPAEKWYANGSPISGFHFDVSELEITKEKIIK